MKNDAKRPFRGVLKMFQAIFMLERPAGLEESKHRGVVQALQLVDLFHDQLQGVAATQRLPRSSVSHGFSRRFQAPQAQKRTRKGSRNAWKRLKII